MPKPRVRIAVAGPEAMHPKCAQSVSSLLLCPEFEFDFREERSWSLVHNKNALAKSIDADSLFFVDPDVAFSLDDFLLLMAADKDVVCGAYLADGERFLCAGGRQVGVSEKGLQAVDWVGMGFTLIRKEVFEFLSFPYFAMPVIREGENPQGEDEYFCRKTGREVFLHCGVKARRLPRETKVSLPDDDWAVVLKAVMAYPLPFEKAGALLKDMRGQFPNANGGGNRAKKGLQA